MGSGGRGGRVKREGREREIYIGISVIVDVVVVARRLPLHPCRAALTQLANLPFLCFAA